MAFTERHHAFISATFYRLLKERCPGTADATFVMATQRYGEQRGSRMAQRAIRDGCPLDFATYKAYGEWTYTEPALAAGEHIKVLSTSPDLHYQVFACPWHDQYLAMDLIEGACLYCQHIDLAIARGFNPSLVFEVRSTMHKQEKCDFVLKGANLDQRTCQADPARVRMPFDYHCGHVYTTFSLIVQSIHGESGKAVGAAALEAFRQAYGEDLARALASFRQVDFNLLP